MRRAAMALVVGALLSGCPGNLDRPERFAKGTDAGADCSKVETEIFLPSCGMAGCHVSPGAANNLDLVSAGIGPRIRDQISTCQSKPMPLFILEKMRGTPPCGQPMPFAADPLPDDEYNCIVQYLAALDGGT